MTPAICHTVRQTYSWGSLPTGMGSEDDEVTTLPCHIPTAVPLFEELTRASLRHACGVAVYATRLALEARWNSSALQQPPRRLDKCLELGLRIVYREAGSAEGQHHIRRNLAAMIRRGRRLELCLSAPEASSAARADIKTPVAQEAFYPRPDLACFHSHSALRHRASDLLVTGTLAPET